MNIKKLYLLSFIFFSVSMFAGGDSSDDEGDTGKKPDGPPRIEI